MTTTTSAIGRWDTAALDVDAYLARIAAPREEPSSAALERLMLAHARAIPFENASQRASSAPPPRRWTRHSACSTRANRSTRT